MNAGTLVALALALFAALHARSTPLTSARVLAALTGFVAFSLAFLIVMDAWLTGAGGGLLRSAVVLVLLAVGAVLAAGLWRAASWAVAIFLIAQVMLLITGVLDSGHLAEMPFADAVATVGTSLALIYASLMLIQVRRPASKETAGAGSDAGA